MKLKALVLLTALIAGAGLPAQTPTPSPKPPAKSPAAPQTQDQHQKMEALTNQYRDQRAQLRNDTSLSASDRQAKTAQIEQDYLASVRQILTSDQYARFIQLRTEHSNRDKTAQH